MPELPEVETVRRILEPQLVGRTILAVQILNDRVIAYPEAGKFGEMLEAQKTTGMTRRGKFLTLHFESGSRLSLHLRMTGQLLVMPAAEPLEKHTHLVISLSDGMQVRYIDVRRFGRFWFFRTGEADNVTGQSELGIEPMDAALSAEYLKSRLGKRRKAIKEMLHDQAIVAGIGNIYSDEILFESGICPGTSCDALQDSDWQRLAAKIPEILQWGISVNETTPEEYLESRAREYRDIPHLRVYGRNGHPCPRCGTIIEKTTIGGRTSCFCPRCQSKSH